MPIERAVGQAILKALAPQGLTALQMVSIVRGAGVGYRYTDMLSDIREYTGRVRYETNIRDMTSNTVVPDAWMNRVELDAPYKYKVWSDIKYWDPVAGDYVTKTRSMYTDSLMKKGDFEGFIEGVEIASEYEPGLVLIEANMRGLDYNTAIE